MTDIAPPTESDLAALADGTLGGARREAAMAAVRSSAQLEAALTEQRRCLEFIDATHAVAPAELRGRIEALIAAAPAPRTRRLTPRLRAGLAVLAGGLAAVAAALVLFTGGASAPTIEQVASLALGRATMAAPPERAANHAQLAASVEGLSFPSWRPWRGVGARMDRVSGRAVMTVFYGDRAGHRVGYAIVSGRVPSLTGGTVRWLAGVRYRVLHEGGANIVAWPRRGHLCVLAARGVPAATLIRLAD